MSRHHILTKINSERKRQDEEYGGLSNDTKHSDHEWLNIIYKQMCLLDEEIEEKDRIDRYVKIAAIAVAAIEAKEHANDQ